MSQKSFESLWTDETKMNLYLSDGKAKVCRKKGTANDPKYTSSSVKHGGGVVMAWICMPVSGTGLLNFTDDLMYDDSSRMNLQGNKTIQPTNIQENATRFIGKCFISHQNNDPKHPTSSVKEFISAKNWKFLRPVQTATKFHAWYSPMFNASWLNKGRQCECAHRRKKRHA